jgi:hypothetical protein
MMLLAILPKKSLSCYLAMRGDEAVGLPITYWPILIWIKVLVQVTPYTLQHGQPCLNLRVKRPQEGAKIVPGASHHP